MNQACDIQNNYTASLLLTYKIQTLAFLPTSPNFIL